MTQPIQTILSKLAIMSKTEPWHGTLLTQWQTIIGSLTTKVTILQIEDDTLVLGVYDACWLQELYCLAPLLCERINKTLEQSYIKAIRFKRTIKKKEMRMPIKSQPMYHVQKVVKKLSDQEKQSINQIADLELQEALLSFRNRCYQEAS